jgi:predicted amidohydrolase YtcJ
MLKYLRERGLLARADFLTLLGAALATSGCSSTIPGVLAPTTPPTGQTILVNGNVLTLAGQTGSMTAVAIGAGKILAVAKSAVALRRRYPRAALFDLDGATLAPGFIEAHAHLSQAALDVISFDLSPYESLPKALDALRRHVAAKKDGTWVFAQGVDTSLLPPTYAPPTLAALDAVSTQCPIFIEDSTGHLAYVNSLAIELAGVYQGQTFAGGGLVGGPGGRRCGNRLRAARIRTVFQACRTAERGSAQSRTGGDSGNGAPKRLHDVARSSSRSIGLIRARFGLLGRLRARDKTADGGSS